jgi:hypothetical protein
MGNLFHIYGMNTRLVLALAVSLLAAPVWAQDYQSSNNKSSTSGSKVQQGTEQPKAGQPLPPKATGVVVMMSEHGLQVINPLAPKALGDGRKLVTQSYVVNPVSTDDPKPYGGINIIGFDF